MSPLTVQLRLRNSEVWLSLDRSFATREDAETYARDLAARWALMVVEWRVVPQRESDDESRLRQEAPPLSATAIAVTLGPITRTYRALCTTAPPEYDAGTSITLWTGSAGQMEQLLSEDRLLSNNKEQSARLVLVEANLFDWHRARYSSGLCMSAEPDPSVLGPPEIAAELLKRLGCGTPTAI
jgi:hypothetical protein